MRQFLRERAREGATIAAAAGTEEVPVRLRRDEIGELTAYGELVANGMVLPDVLSQLVRRGALELKVAELVARSRQSAQESRATRERVEGLERAGAELARRGIVGR